MVLSEEIIALYPFSNVLTIFGEFGESVFKN
jgi:hypothetical protein